VHAFEAPLLEDKYKEDPALYVQQKAKSKWDANWDRYFIVNLSMLYIF
jgi:hypothetical protein